MPDATKLSAGGRRVAASSSDPRSSVRVCGWLMDTSIVVHVCVVGEYVSVDEEVAASRPHHSPAGQHTYMGPNAIISRLSLEGYRER